MKEGNTAILARSIAKALSADLFEIRPVKPYPAGYEDTKTIASEELRKGLLPAFEGKPARLKEAGVVYVGCPVWWGAPPQIVLSFLKQCPELDGKTLVPFGTHGGSGMGSLEALLRRLFPASTVRRALSVPGTAVREPGLEQTVRDWLKAQ